MGGTDNDTANVISTMLFLSGITTILHSYFGTRLPLVQGSSFVYLAPALVIMNSEEFRNLTHHVSFTYRQINVNSFAFEYRFWFSILIMYCRNCRN